MGKYIDTDTAYEVLTKYYHHKTEAQHEALMEALDRVPAADVAEMTLENAVDYLHSIGWMQDHDRQMMEMGQEVRHGRWIIEDKYTDYRTERCSACGFAANRAYIQDIWHYCPNCGAKMDEVTE